MKIIGHRGCRGLYPENTIIAFKEAIKMGVHALELDVVMSGDNQIVVSHEPFMSQITCLKPCGSEISSEEDRKFNLFKMSYDEIKSFDCGLKDNYKFPHQKSVAAYKPLLKETIQICEQYATSLKRSVEYIIEIKSQPELYEEFYPTPEHYVRTLLQTLEQYSISDRIILKSFDVSVLNEIKRQYPSQKISLLINRDESIADKLNLLNVTPEILGPYFELLDATVVNSYKKKGFAILPWTVNDITEINTLVTYGVDGLITDFPNRVISLV